MPVLLVLRRARVPNFPYRDPTYFYPFYQEDYCYDSRLASVSLLLLHIVGRVLRVCLLPSLVCVLLCVVLRCLLCLRGQKRNCAVKGRGPTINSVLCPRLHLHL